MDNISKTENLFNDRVRKLSGNIVPASLASLVNALILAVVCRNVVGTRTLAVWTGGITTVILLRLYLKYYYTKIEKNSRNLRRFWTLFILTLIMAGIFWGLAAIFLFPPDSIGHQVFIAFVLGGMVAGTVGTYSAKLDAFFAFSVPALFPVIIRFYMMGEEFHLAMGFMILLFWIIMLLTALRLNRDIISYIQVKYDNIDLISDLEAEVKVREAAELNLKKRNLEIEGIVQERTAELLSSNKKLINEIDERRQIAEALKENEEKYRDLVENINDVIYSANEQGIVTYVSPVIRSVLGYEPGELVGKTLDEFVHIDDLPMFSNVLPERLAGKTDSIEYRFRTKKNNYRWVRSSSRAVYKEERFVALRGALTDISEKRKLEEQLRRAHKMEAIGTLSGGIAHDFNNLLAVILGNSELALYDLPPGHPIKAYLDRILATTMRAKGIVKELLSFASQTGMERNPIHIPDAIGEEVERLLSEIPAAINLETDIAPDTRMVSGDPGQIRQVLRNLCENALDAMADMGGALTIRIDNVSLTQNDMEFDSDMGAGDYVRMHVGDTGTGIASKDIRRVFDPYFTTKDVGKGDGLGLAVVHGIVKRHGGGVRVTSEPGKGACFDAFFSRHRKSDGWRRIPGDCFGMIEV